MFKKLFPFLAGGFVFFTGYQIVTTGMYTYQVSQFYGVDYSFSEHGIALNGKSSFGNMINVQDLTAYEPAAGGSSVKDVCRDVESQRGHTTLGFVGDIAVCCWVADENQWLVPFKDEGKTRHYLCGKWPNLDHVTQQISKSKLALFK